MSASSLDVTADVPDGDYDVIVDQIELTATPALVWHLRIADGPYAGRQLWKRRLVTELTRAAIRDDFEKCGVALETCFQVPRGLDQLSGLRVPVMKRTQDCSDVKVHIQWPAEASPL
ncbi:MAG: DUF669 domain-containing protein [Bryobacteraceae bacterium]|nr:DUF669 domain-containing protein [Bryobacteraceae bacterium]